MLDLGLFDSIRLSNRPPLQRLIADGFLRLDYRDVDITLEGLERLPRCPVVYAMNHTDNFNYWPFQYSLHRRFERYTATWVKGKNFEQPLVAAFMRGTNNIPIASRGYLITRDFLATLKRKPEEAEYRALRDAVDDGVPVPVGTVPREVLEKGRDMLGRPFDPRRERYEEAMNALFAAMMRRFLALNRHALAIGLDILVFPQGTRSTRLSRGHIGLIQAALALNATVVPVGCNGSDRVYPGRSFVSKPGRVVYRIGRPFAREDFADLAPRAPFEPFSREAEHEHREAFQALTDRVMNRVDGLLDPEYRFADDHASDGTRGTDRFL